MKQKISLLDDSREVLGAFLKKNGHSYNSKNPEELEQAKKELRALRPSIKMFRSDLVDPLVNKEVAVAQAYSADALQARRKTQGKIDFIIPREGTSRAIDNFVLVNGAKNTQNAYKLINFLMRPDINAQIVEHVLSGPVLKSTRAKLPSDLQKDPLLFPSAETKLKFEGLQDLGDTTLALIGLGRK